MKTSSLQCQQVHLVQFLGQQLEVGQTAPSDLCKGNQPYLTIIRGLFYHFGCHPKWRAYKCGFLIEGICDLTRDTKISKPHIASVRKQYICSWKGKLQHAGIFKSNKRNQIVFKFTCAFAYSLPNDEKKNNTNTNSHSFAKEQKIIVTLFGCFVWNKWILRKFTTTYMYLAIQNICRLKHFALMNCFLKFSAHTTFGKEISKNKLIFNASKVTLNMHDHD